MVGNNEDKIKILLVDDREENLIALEELLDEVDNIQFLKSTSGQDALWHLYSNDIALVLLDVQMPEMDGYEVARLLKGSSKTKNIPIIFVTAINKDETHVLKGYDDGAVDYIFKPLNPQITRAKVKSFIQLYRLQSKLKESNAKLQDFAQMVSQNLQKPLLNIFISAEEMEKTDDQAAIREYVSFIKEASKKMRDIVSDLLKDAKIDPTVQ